MQNPTTELEQLLDLAAADMVPEPPAEDASDDEKKRASEWSIQDEEQLAWTTRQYAKADHLLTEAEQAAKAQVARITDWLNKVTREQNARREFFRQKAEDYLVRRQQQDRKLKGIPTPYGRVQSRVQQPEWRVQNKMALVEGIRATGVPRLADALIQVKEEPRLGEIKDLATLGTDVQLVEITRDPITRLPIYRVEARQVNPDDGTVTWVELPGLTVADRPAKITVEVSRS